MPRQVGNWTNALFMKAKHLTKKSRADRKQPEASVDASNPWLALMAEQTNVADVEARGTQSLHTSDIHPTGPSRWVDGDFSPYGFAEDDGALKQVEGPGWRNIYDQQPPSGSELPGKSSEQFGQGELKSVEGNKPIFPLQLILAVGIVACGLYAARSPQPLAKGVNQFARSVLSVDDTQRVIPTLSRVFDHFHLTLPTFNVQAALYMHAPLIGTINTDFSSSHPEMQFIGAENAPVLAAGSGIVTKLNNTGAGKFVEIDHGSIGTSIYAGIAVVSVHLHEYVDSGQVIGRLPTGVQRPELRFAMMKNGKFENPHDFIHFSTGGK